MDQEPRTVSREEVKSLAKRLDPGAWEKSVFTIRDSNLRRQCARRREQSFRKAEFNLMLVRFATIPERSE